MKKRRFISEDQIVRILCDARLQLRHYVLTCTTSTIMGYIERKTDEWFRVGWISWKMGCSFAASNVENSCRAFLTIDEVWLHE